MMMNRHTLQQQPVAAADLAEPVSMKEWTGGAIDSLTSKSNESKHPSKDEIVCSHAYMSCALKIAHSLADQLSTVEEERRDLLLQDSYDNNNIPLLVDTIDNNKSWSEYISVYCMKRSIDEENGEISVNNNKGDNVEGASIDIDADIQPLPFNFYGGGGDNSEQPEELQNLEHRLSTLFDINNVNQSIDYLNVRGAIVNEEAATDGKLFHSANGTLEIRSLGIAFYELFSGGQITTTAEAGVPQQPSYPTQSPSLHNVGQTALELHEHERPGESELINTIGGPSKRMSQSNISLGKSSQKTISVEPLQLLGLPTSLCDLISNMIKSGNGETHGGIEEAYEFISEVRDDLKLMIDSPNIYLQDIDLAEATNVGLQFGSSLHGREAEMQSLKESCQRSISTGCEVAMICGTSGIGKSKLSDEFARSAKESGSIFISGRCDKLQSQPLKPISSAYNKYCAWLSVNDRSTAEKIAAALKEYLGEDLASLVSAMPNLANILGDDFDSTENENDTAMDSQKRLRYLFCVFTGVISSCHDTPLIFFLDDCQWMDSATVALLNQIMIMTGVDIEDNGFFFGCYRDDEMGETHPLFQMLSTVNSLCGTKTTKIHLTPMSKGDLNEMVSATLNLLPRITRPLADMLHHRTKGSPLFVKQVMMDLYKQRLLYPSLSRRRWVWEFDKILEMKIPENVAAFITKSFDRLPSEVLSALVVLSCFGASADISLIEVLEREIQQPLIAPLDVAVAHSVLGKRNGEFYFMHDKLQEAAYSMVKPEERCLHHNRYGLALGFVAEREKDDKMLLTAVGQINHGGSQVVIDDEQAIVVANLNLDAGMKAMIMSDFFLAHSFFNHGISFLRRGHWTEHYDLSLQLFNLAAKCALLNAEHESLQALIDQIMQNAKCFEDKTQAISNRVTLLTWSGNVLGAIELVNSTLSSLGEGLPAKITSSVIKQNLDNTKAQLASLSDDTLLSYPAMVNPSKILALELFTNHFQILPLVHQTAVMPLIPLKIIQISLAYGMSPRSPIGFAQYGNFLVLVRDEFEEGYRYVKFALSLMKKIPSRAYAGSVMFHANYTKVHVEPMQSVIECYLDAYFASMKSGNPYAIGCSYVYNTFCFWSGKELKAVVSSMKETLMESKYQKNLLVRALMLPTFRMVLRLMGLSSAPQQDHDINTSAEARNEDDIKQVLHLRAVFFVRLSEALIFRELDEARDAAKEYFSIGEVGCKFAVTTIPLFFMRLYSGLVSFWIGREINDKKKESMKWLARGVACKDEIEKLAASASKWNFQNKVYLLQAEEQFCRMNFEEAEKLYDAAILTSKTHKFLNEEALANELAGHFYLETGRRERSVHYFSQAFEKYNEWGAAAKANMLTKYLDGR